MSGCQTFTDDEICQLAMQKNSKEPEDNSEDEVDNNITVSKIKVISIIRIFQLSEQPLDHRGSDK